ncbi:hypothetical protein BFJ63_vAg14915 [Fusarium oxysporum f. sp. narcissi]|uniref:Uncharacterized protein n=1 Tax=Fusarium oxysporum f. sp. narcissi TaxID=451672 RepID=A0A4Q2VDY1_FUSOX|nr:hypothetical protein BFJ63_vAg14915 [Fusarium oxysporum f. sp. narcissi]
MRARSPSNGWKTRNPSLIKSLFQNRIGTLVSSGFAGDPGSHKEVENQKSGIQESVPEPMDIDTEGELTKMDVDMDIPTIVIHPPSDNDGDDDEMKDDLDETQGICATIEGQLEIEMRGLTVRHL